MDIVTRRADSIIPGDILDTRCGTGDLAYAKVLSVRVIENSAPLAQDRIEVTLEGDAISNTRLLLAGSLVRTVA